MGADMEHALQSEQSARRILMALNNTPESKAAITWAVGNLVREGDQVLLYHMVKTPTLIPTAMGMVPYVGATPEMQRAHILVASWDGTELLRSFQAYCKSKMVYVRVDVGRCDHRHAELLRKAKEEGATHLVLGTGGGSRFGFWLAKKPSLTARICQHAPCHVILVDKKKRPTFHPPNPEARLSRPSTANSRSKTPENCTTPPSQNMARLQHSSSTSLEPRAKSVSLGVGSVSPRRAVSLDHRAGLSLEVPSEIVFGEMPTPPSDAGRGDAKDSAMYSLPPHLAAKAPRNPEPTDPSSPASTASSYFTLQGADVTLREKMEAIRTWSQDLELFSLPESDEDCCAANRSDAGADSELGARSNVSADTNSGASADASAGESADVSATDVGADALSAPLDVLPGRQAGDRFSTGRKRPSSAGELEKAEPVEKDCNPRPETQSGKVIGGQLPGSESASFKHGFSSNLAPRLAQTPPSTMHRPVKPVDALISRICVAVNEPDASPFLTEPPSDSPAKARASSPRPRGIPRQKAKEPMDKAPAFESSVLRTLIRPRSAHPPSSDGRRTADGRTSDGRLWTLDEERLDRPWSAGGQPTDGRRTSDGPSPFRRNSESSFYRTFTGGRRSSGKTRTLSDAHSVAGQEALILQLKEQATLLFETNDSRNRECERVSNRADVAKRAALIRERAFLTEKIMREEAERRARRSVNVNVLMA